MKKLITLFLFVIMLFSAVPAYASTSADLQHTTKTYYLEDGSYYVDTTTVQLLNARAAARDASKTREFYDSNDKLAWTFTVSGTFTYDGVKATASKPSCLASIKISGWTCSSKSATVSGAKAIGKATFKFNSTPQSTEVTLTCSPSGQIS